MPSTRFLPGLIFGFVFFLLMLLLVDFQEAVDVLFGDLVIHHVLLRRTVLFVDLPFF